MQWAEFRESHGSPRMFRELRERGFRASKPRVERLMRENDIRARHKRRYKVTTDSKHNLPIAQNLLDRNFNPAAPNQIWTSDIVNPRSGTDIRHPEDPQCGQAVLDQPTLWRETGPARQVSRNAAFRARFPPSPHRRTAPARRRTHPARSTPSPAAIARGGCAPPAPPAAPVRTYPDRANSPR